MMMRLTQSLVIAFVLVFFNCYTGTAVEQSYLKSEDVGKVMGQILQKHVRNKEVTIEILRTSFKVYIDQFDPDRIYLLESEVLPFYNMTDSEMKRILKQYKRNDFSAYEGLNKVIQLAIKRAQKNRQTWVDHQDIYSSSILGSAYSDEDPGKRRFARNAAELKERQKQEMFRFVQDEVKRYGEGLMGSKQMDLVKLYDDTMKEREAGYLFVDDRNQLFSAQQKENLFIMHIIKALAKSLDAHTSFFNSNEAYDLRVRLEKGFDGLGIVLNKDSIGYRVVKLIDKSPADKNGRIEINDYLMKINGEALDNIHLDQVMKMLRGKTGTPVSLLLKRVTSQGDKDRESFYNVVLKRAPVVINDGRVETSYLPFGDGIIGTIKLHAFYQGQNGISSEKDVENAIKELSKKGNLRGLVLDMRDNSGGFLTQAVKVAGLFITNGVIVVSKYSNGEERYYRDMDGKVSYKGPLIVLTSRATASAAEIVAQALQDYGVALVVGDEQTYGKGTIQSQTVTNDGNDSSYFKVTVGKYYTVSGKTPQINGVKADIVVPSPYSLEQIGEEYLEYPIGKDTIPSSFKDPLQDIDPGLRPWYLRYYVPTLQKQTQMWHENLPSLRKKSEYRLAHNARYKEFLENGRFDEDHDFTADNLALQENEVDPQHHEALNIAKDMIILESEMKNNKSLGVTRHLIMGEK